MPFPRYFFDAYMSLDCFPLDNLDCWEQATQLLEHQVSKAWA